MTPPELTAALRSYARYAGVLADQLEALRRGDAARQWVLEHERAAAERDVARLLEDDAGQADRVFAAAVAAVGGAAAELGLVRERIARLDDETRRVASQVPVVPATPARTTLARRAADAGARGPALTLGALDVRR